MTLLLAVRTFLVALLVGFLLVPVGTCLLLFGLASLVFIWRHVKPVLMAFVVRWWEEKL
jgi:hypothetical protein